MPMPINGKFIKEWDPQYPDNDEPRYEYLVATVQNETGGQRSIAQTTFEEIVGWKTRNRSRRHLRLREYDRIYAPAFVRCLRAAPHQRLSELIASGLKLPGVGAPLASTVLHFLFPTSMPIIDVRTVEVLHHFGYVPTKGRELRHYEDFRKAVEEILAISGATLRQLDRALFAYHKLRLSPRDSGIRKCQTK
jgi:hypothetical protein